MEEADTLSSSSFFFFFNHLKRLWKTCGNQSIFKKSEFKQVSIIHSVKKRQLKDNSQGLHTYVEKF